MGITFSPIILSHLYKELQMYSLLMQMVWLLVYLHPDLDCTQVYYEYVKYAISNSMPSSCCPFSCNVEQDTLCMHLSFSSTLLKLTSLQ